MGSYVKQGGRILFPKPQELVLRTNLALQANGDYPNSLLPSFIHVRLHRELMSDVSGRFSAVWKIATPNTVGSLRGAFEELPT